MGYDTGWSLIEDVRSLGSDSHFKFKTSGITGNVFLSLSSITQGEKPLVQCVVSSLNHVWLFCDLRLLFLWDFPGKILEWAAISFSRASSQSRDWTYISCVSCLAGRFFTDWATREARYLDTWLLIKWCSWISIGGEPLTRLQRVLTLLVPSVLNAGKTTQTISGHFHLSYEPPEWISYNHSHSWMFL